MRNRLAALLAAILVLAACSGDDPELSTDSTIVTGGTNAPAPATSTTNGGTAGGTSPSTTLAGQNVESFEVVANIPNDQGVAQHIVIPNGAYTDVDLENFVIELIDSNPDLYGAEIFDSADAAAAFAVAPAQRTEDQTALIERHHFVSLVGRDRIEFRGPFAEFPGGAIGS